MFGNQSAPQRELAWCFGRGAVAAALDGFVATRPDCSVAAEAEASPFIPARASSPAATHSKDSARTAVPEGTAHADEIGRVTSDYSVQIGAPQLKSQPERPTSH